MSRWMSLMYVFTPVDTDRISAMPMMPIEPAERGQQGCAPSWFQIVEAQRQRRGERHRRAAHRLVHGRLFGRLVHDERVGVGADHAVAQVDDARGILFRKFGGCG